jgi:hypothetical protein
VMHTRSACAAHIDGLAQTPRGRHLPRLACPSGLGGDSGDTVNSVWVRPHRPGYGQPCVGRRGCCVPLKRRCSAGRREASGLGGGLSLAHCSVIARPITRP